MSYNIITIPINGNPYIKKCNKIIKFENIGIENSISILPLAQHKEIHLIAFAYNDDNSYPKTDGYNYKNNRTCNINICSIEKNNFIGLESYIADAILKKF